MLPPMSHPLDRVRVATALFVRARLPAAEPRLCRGAACCARHKFLARTSAV